jgi:uncharacterized protein
VHCCVSGDAAAAAAAARTMVLRYVMHPAAPRLFGEADGDVDLRGVRELVLAGDRSRAADQVPQQVADGFVAHGGAARCAARLADYRAAGVDLPVLFPIPVAGDWGYEQTIAALGSTAPATKPNGRREALRLSRRTVIKDDGINEDGAISEEVVIRFFAALEAGDISTVRDIYAPDAVVWHNDDLFEQPVEENLKTLQGTVRAISGLRYDIVRRVATADGVLQQHVLRGRLPDGTEAELHAAMYLQVRDGHITRIEEYLDSARRSSLKAAREALAGQ